MSQNEPLVCTKEEEIAVLELRGRTPDSFRDDVEIVKNWIKTQPHFPEMPPDEVIRSFLCMNKCSIENAKKALDSYYSIRNFIPEFFCHHPLSLEMIEGRKVWYHVVLPRLVGLDKVTIFKFADTDPEKFDLEIYYSQVMNTNELYLLYGLHRGNVVVLDLTGTKLSHFVKYHPVLLGKLRAIAEKVYSSSVTALHFINSSDVFLTVAKSVLKEKIRERIHIHKTYEALYKFIPREVLPKDFGGEEKSLKELAELQMRYFERHRERFDALVKMKTKEELRPGKPVNDEFLGYYGSFKQINVD